MRQSDARSQLSRRWLPYLALIIGLIAVSTASSLIRLAQNDGAPSLAIAAWRLALAALLLTPIALTHYRAEIARLRPAQVVLAIVSGGFLAVHFATWITSLAYVSVINAVVLVTIHPIFVALVSVLFLHERLDSRTWLGIGLALLGSVIVSVAGGSGAAPIHNAPLLGDILAVMGALGTTGYFIVGARLRASVSVVPYIWISYSAAAIFLIAAAAITGQGMSGLPTSAFLWMTLLALVPQLIGHSAHNYALGYLSTAYVSLTILGESIGSGILAVLLFQEYPQPIQIIGAALILGAIFLAGRAESTRAATTSDVVALTESGE